MADVELTPAALVEICKEYKLYRTPELNDTLYCNNRGFGALGPALAPYVGLKALYLDGNALRSLAGLPLLQDLRCLYVQNNALSSLDGVANAPGLATLQVSGNMLGDLSPLKACAALQTLIADGNQLESAAALEPLADGCPQLQSLDLKRNRIGGDPDALLAVLRRMRALRCLYLAGNPVVSAMQSYRKAVVAALPGLTYLDDRPVFDEERRCAEAWERGGLEEERLERQRCRDDAEAERRRNFEWMQELRRSGFRKRREMLGLPPGDTDPMLDGMSDGDDGASTGSGGDDDGGGGGSREPEELVKARVRLAALAAAHGQQLGDPLGGASGGAAGALPSDCAHDQASDGKLAGAAGNDAGSAAAAASAAAATAAADARDYYASVREEQAALDAEGAELLAQMAVLNGMAADERDGGDSRTGGDSGLLDASKLGDGGGAAAAFAAAALGTMPVKVDLNSLD